MKKLLLAGALLLAVAAPASAATITIVDQTLANVTPPDDSGQVLGMLTFTGGTLVGLNLNGAGQDIAFDTSDASLATVTTLFNSQTGLNLSGGVQTTTFPATTDSTYIGLKIGEDVAFFHNTTGTLLSLVYAPQDGAGAGFSTAYLFGGTPIVTTPLPGAALLFGTGLAGLGMLGLRRKRKAQA